MLRVSDFAAPDEPMAIAVFRFFRDKLITEATTDLALEFLKDKIKIKWLPFSGWIVNRVLDPLLPEKLLGLIKHLILVTRLATETDFIHMDSPLRPR
jgi:hypothetical protein